MREIFRVVPRFTLDFVPYLVNLDYFLDSVWPGVVEMVGMVSNGAKNIIFHTLSSLWLQPVVSSSTLHTVYSHI